MYFFLSTSTLSFLRYKLHAQGSSALFFTSTVQNSLRPDITVMVDWALKINYLSVYLNSLYSRRQDRLPSSSPVVKITAPEYGGGSRGYAPGSLFNKRLAVKEKGRLPFRHAYCPRGRILDDRLVTNKTPGSMITTQRTDSWESAVLWLLAFSRGKAAIIALEQLRESYH